MHCRFDVSFHSTRTTSTNDYADSTRGRTGLSVSVVALAVMKVCMARADSGGRPNAHSEAHSLRSKKYV